MQQVIDRSSTSLATLRQAKWQGNVAMIAGLLLGVIFLVSGGWKVFDPFKTGELLEQAQVPAGFGPLGAAALGSIELFTAFLLFIPSYRRWGGILGSLLLIFFIGWIGFYYHVLAGRECSCFPLIKRTIGPMFFVSDGIMLLLGLAASSWSAALKNVKVPLLVLASIVVLAGAKYSVDKSHRIDVQVPNPVIVDGKPTDLTHGQVFLFFYDPSCMHCDAAARYMSGFDWKETRVVTIPTINPQWAASFLRETHLKAATSLELEKLKKAFPFVDPPYGVALENGAAKETFGQAEFNSPLPKPALQHLGFVK